MRPIACLELVRPFEQDFMQLVVPSGPDFKLLELQVEHLRQSIRRNQVRMTVVRRLVVG